MASMDAMAKIGEFFDFFGSFFSEGGPIPWCDKVHLTVYIDSFRDILDDPHRTEEQRSQIKMRLACYLVLSDQSEEVPEGIRMLESWLPGGDPLARHVSEEHHLRYFVAIGYYRRGDYSKSMEHVDRCIEIAPHWRQALTLKKIIAKGSIIRRCIKATAIGAVGLISAGMIASLLARKKMTPPS